MPRKSQSNATPSGIGTGDRFDSEFKKIARLGDPPQSSKFSFKVSAPEFEELSGKLCTDAFVAPYNLSLTNKRGRSLNEIVTYSASQLNNYPSQLARYEKARKTPPTDIIERNGKKVYRFCSKRAIGGFWEVTFTSGSYIKLTQPILTIVCPQPFRLSDFGGMQTDGDSFKWTQTQGRLTIISPSTGAEALDPYFSIIGFRESLDPPILISVELEDDPNIFEFLLIYTNATSRASTGSQTAISAATDSAPCHSIPCQLTPIPKQPNTGFQWLAGNLEFTWELPTCNTANVDGFYLQTNVSGQYQTVQEIGIASSRKVTFSPNTYSRIVTRFRNQVGDYSYSESCRFFFLLPNSNFGYVFVDERCTVPTLASLQLQATQFDVQVANTNALDRMPNASAIGTRFIAVEYAVSSQSLQSTSSASQASQSCQQVRAIVYDVGGAVIG